MNINNPQMFTEGHIQTDLFEVGQLYPSPLHIERIKRYRDNKRLFKGEQLDVFKKHFPELDDRYRNTIYTAVNLP
ncbi:hypothetical protein R2R70_19370, partial [Cobetia sp. SIMBA_158]|uniref:hypothetical protein n=1 Tax=Cobetia sp. SIMBA_158 TaxID=3081617 RepID=UPI003980AFE7